MNAFRSIFVSSIAAKRCRPPSVCRNAVCFDTGTCEAIESFIAIEQVPRVFEGHLEIVRRLLIALFFHVH